MKSVCLAVSLLLAATAHGAQWQTVLTNDNTVWSVNGMSVSVKLDLMRRDGDVTTVVRVPGTEDGEIESQARLAWDAAARSLFLMWRHGDEYRLSRLDARGTWSQPLVVTRGDALDGLQFVLTRAPGATLLHAAWWSGETAEYALVAFDGAEHLSTSVRQLDDLANVRASTTPGEDTGLAAHPPLAMSARGDSVDVAYGAPRSTVITRLTIKPEKIGGDARMWRPSGRHGRRSDPAGLVSSTAAPVQSFIVEGRIVLYTAEARFRYVVLENNRWSPIRMLALDRSLTSDEVLRALRRSVLEHGADDAPASE